ncbi:MULTISPECIES: helix-turn-helix domain-containing protein [unclassified Caulobacter]|uniref:helix-turn-helix domain-containing protein n=1 Tax=unclassified Caulobacter TaxID=2648921 RepID=UPI000D38BB8A|nr:MULTISPECIES: AraC family transcriptional regulator [unclassified Caulobacter]PTS81641.1 AraC family transcriptional regulator [Caulobacter sp. HMWF009]PTT13009.1 AraC family transcriptional regulator [Caulobacter sp. HMWF025]
MFPVRRQRPSRALSPYVKAYEERVQRLDRTVVLRPLPARTEQFLEFYLADRYRVREIASGAVETAPDAVLVGMQTYRRVDIVLAGTLRLFTIQFTPTGFSGLFGAATAALTDQAFAARDVLGREVAEVSERLEAAPDFASGVAVAEAWLLGRVPTGDPDPIAWAARRMTTLHGGVRVADLARAVALGERQFERRFTRAVGVSPKRYARVLRFREALRLKTEGLEPGWAGVAQAAGYVDQAHMIHEFQALAGDTPERLIAAMAPARETVVPGDGNLQSRRSSPA